MHAARRRLLESQVALLIAVLLMLFWLLSATRSPRSSGARAALPAGAAVPSLPTNPQSLNPAPQ